MKRSLPEQLTQLFVVLTVCAGYGLLYALAFYRLVSISYFTLFLDGFIDAVFFMVLGVLLYKAIRYGNYAALEIYQRFINYLALGLLVVGVWIGLSLLLSYFMVEKENMKDLWAMIPMKALIGLLVYLFVVQLIHNRLGSQIEEQEDEEILPETQTKDEEVTEMIDRVVVKTGQKIHVINVVNIVYIQSDGDYVQIYTEQNHFLKEETMKYFEIHLPSATFVRVHRSYIVNVEKILRIELYEKKNQILTLTNGQKIKASASGYKLLREALNL